MNRLHVFLLISALILALSFVGCSKESKRESADRASLRGAEARSANYVASVAREPFHNSDCKWAKKISEFNLVGYDTKEDAIADGHRPCKVCRP